MRSKSSPNLGVIDSNVQYTTLAPRHIKFCIAIWVDSSNYCTYPLQCRRRQRPMVSPYNGWKLEVSVTYLTKESTWWRFHVGKAYRRRIQCVVQLRQPLSCYVNSFLVGLASAVQKQFPPRNIPSCPNTSPAVAAHDEDNEGKSH